MGMKVKGMKEAITGCDRLKEELPNSMSDGLDKCMDYLYDETQIEVPKKTGDLAATAHVVEHETIGNTRSKGLRYGEPGEGEGVIDYAAAVHEIIGASHAPPTKAKFVEDPLVQGLDEYRKFLSESSDNAVKEAFQ